MTAAEFPVHDFTSRDWLSIPDFMPATRIAALRDECLALQAAGRFRPAGVGREAVRDPSMRGDAILWLEPDSAEAPQAMRLLREEFAALQRTINAATYLGLQDFEGHYAAYPAGAGYGRHLDRFRDDDRRVISVVLYLNDAWRSEYGGELCMYEDEGTVPAACILPAGGTLACFLSERVPHEVRPAQRARLSLTGWFRRGR